MTEYQGWMMFLASVGLARGLLCRQSARRLTSSSHTTSSPIHAMSLQNIISKMEEIVQRDEGKRGIREIIPSSPELLNAAHAMIAAKNIANITGFPCLLDYTPPTETDGPLGALAIAKSLVALGKKVRVLTDECNEEVLLACGLASGLHKYGDRFAMESFPPLDRFDFKDEERLNEIADSIDLVVAIERAGPNAEGKYFTMRCRDMTSIVAPLDILIAPSEETLSSDNPQIKTKINSIGIGKLKFILYALSDQQYYTVVILL